MTLERHLDLREAAAAEALASYAAARGDHRAAYVCLLALGKTVGIVGRRISRGVARRRVRQVIALGTRTIIASLLET